MYIQFYKDKRSLNKKYWKIVYIQQLYREGSTTLDKTCWDKSWKSSKFKKWLNFSNSKFSPLRPNINVDSGHFFLFSILSEQFCPRLKVIDFFWKNDPKWLSGIEMHVGAMYALNSINSKL